MHLDRAHAHEEGLRDLLVREPVRCQLDDTTLGLGQLARRLRTAPAYPGLLSSRLLGPAGRAQLVELARRLVERPAGGAS